MPLPPAQRPAAVTPRIGYVVGRLDRAIRREIGALVAPFGLTVPKYTALSILRDRPGLSNAQLARRSYVTPQSMNEVLRALEGDDLIVRSPAAHHGRVVELTAGNLPVQETLRQLLDEYQHRYLSHVGHQVALRRL